MAKIRRKHVLLGILLGLVAIPSLIVVASYVGPPIEGRIRYGLLYEFPAGFKGWSLIVFDVPSCPPLTEKDRYIVISFPPSGRTCTSNPFPQGWRQLRFEYVHPDGRRSEIDRRMNISSMSSNYGVTRFPNELIFVGTEEELKQTPPGRERDWCLVLMLGLSDEARHHLHGEACSKVEREREKGPG